MPSDFLSSGGSKGGRTKFSQFHAVFRKIWKNCMLAPPSGGLAPPPIGNPGSAPVNHLALQIIVTGLRLL